MIVLVSAEACFTKKCVVYSELTCSEFCKEDWSVKSWFVLYWGMQQLQTLTILTCFQPFVTFVLLGDNQKLNINQKHAIDKISNLAADGIRGFNWIPTCCAHIAVQMPTLKKMGPTLRLLSVLLLIPVTFLGDYLAGWRVGRNRICKNDICLWKILRIFSFYFTFLWHCCGNRRMLLVVAWRMTFSMLCACYIKFLWDLA